MNAATPVNETTLSKLPNGLTLITQPVHAAPVVAFQVWIHAGGFDELDGERGLAHLHEHMLFKGTPTRGVGEVAAAVEAAGGHINAWTSHDQTVYHVVMPAHAWKTGLDVLSDAVCHSLFDADELSREIEVVVEEIKRAEDSPGRVAWRQMFGQIFTGHPYSLPVLGTIDSVRSMTSERMKAFWGKHYVAKNTTVVAAGDLDPAEVAREVEARFSDYGLSSAQEKPASAPPKPEPLATITPSQFSETRAMVAFPGPDLSHEDVAPLDVFALVLGQGESSRLSRSVRRDLQLANDISASCYTPRYAGVFSLGMLTDAERVEAAFDAGLAELQRALTFGITAEELEKAKNLILAEATYKRETVQGLANSVGYFAVACGDPAAEQRYFDAVAKVTCEDVLRVARAWLTPDHAQVVVLLGKDAEDGPTLPEPAAWLAKVTAAVTQIDPAVSAGTHGGSEDIVDGIERIELPSGDILLVRADGGDVPVMSLRVAALAGLRTETAANSGHGRMLAELLTAGTSRRTSEAISQAAESMASDISGFSGRNSIGLTMHSLTRNGDATLDLLFDCVNNATLPQSEIEIVRKAQLQDIHHASDAPARTAFRGALEALYGDHPYALDSLGTAESVTALDRDTLRGLLKGRLAGGQPGSPRLVWAAAGDVNAAELAAKIAAASPSSDGALPVPVSRDASFPTERIEVRHEADKAQAHVVLAFPGTRLDHPDRFPLAILSTVLSGQAGRLFLQLRDKQSLAYTVSSMSAEGLDAGHFAFYIGTSPDKVDTALSGLYGEIDKVLQTQITADELDRAKQLLSGGHAIGLQRSGARAATIGFNELYGLPRGAWSAWLSQMMAVTAADVQAAARRYLTVGQHVEAVLKP
ncbi:MAG: insulinase family protein [Myxococcales bacterium]|nr:insulinase family protein [Myxococcales bacterium]